MVGAAAARSQAARSMIRSAGNLPEPRLSAEAMRFRNGDVGLEVELEQDLPGWGARSAARAGAGAEAIIAERESRLLIAQAAADLARTLVRASTSDEQAVLLEGSAQRMRLLLETRLALAGVGDEARAPEILALRNRLDALELEIQDLRRSAEDARADAHALLGTNADTPLPEALVPLVQ
ncbi:MAG: hypothetical protein H0X45_12715, partial [Planctomycetes bacterium]|nr:hypothetical protein [Planctomycetota bacterium]